VLGYLSEAGYATAGSDAIASEVFQHPHVQAGLAEILGGNAPVTRDSIRSRLDDPEVRRRVNALMHPRILELLRGSQAQVVEVPLLIETCLQVEFSRVWVVTCGPEEQLRRLTARLQDESSARVLLTTQLSTRTKCAFADRIIRTNLPESTVRRLVLEAMKADAW